MIECCSHEFLRMYAPRLGFSPISLGGMRMRVLSYDLLSRRARQGTNCSICYRELCMSLATGEGENLRHTHVRAELCFCAIPGKEVRSETRRLRSGTHIPGNARSKLQAVLPSPRHQSRRSRIAGHPLSSTYSQPISNDFPPSTAART